MWHVIKSQTSVGKTFAYLKLAEELGSKFLIVVPTNILKQDVQTRADELGLLTAVSPSLDEIKDELPPYVCRHICKLRDAGLYTQVYPYINKLSNEGDKTLQAYLKQLNLRILTVMQSPRTEGS